MLAEDREFAYNYEQLKHGEFLEEAKSAFAIVQTRYACVCLMRMGMGDLDLVEEIYLIAGIAPLQISDEKFVREWRGPNKRKTRDNLCLATPQHRRIRNQDTVFYQMYNQWTSPQRL